LISGITYIFTNFSQVSPFETPTNIFVLSVPLTRLPQTDGEPTFKLHHAGKFIGRIPVAHGFPELMQHQLRRGSGYASLDISAKYGRDGLFSGSLAYTRRGMRK
jgi:hypothetical protein